MGSKEPLKRNFQRKLLTFKKTTISDIWSLNHDFFKLIKKEKIFWNKMQQFDFDRQEVQHLTRAHHEMDDVRTWSMILFFHVYLFYHKNWFLNFWHDSWIFSRERILQYPQINISEILRSHRIVSSRALLSKKLRN